MVHVQGITGSELWVAVAGVRGVAITDVEETLRGVREAAGGARLQLFDAGSVAGWRHIYHAAVNALNAFVSGTAVSNSLEVETMLYASCQDQISKAFTMMGVSLGTSEAAVLVFSETTGAAREAAVKAAKRIGVADDQVLEVSEGKLTRLKELFEIEEEAIGTLGVSQAEALTSLVVEKGALLPLRR